jgi:hypothetical protein
LPSLKVIEEDQNKLIKEKALTNHQSSFQQIAEGKKILEGEQGERKIRSYQFL